VRWESFSLWAPIAALLLGSSVITPVCADVVILKGGIQLRGRVTERGDQLVVTSDKGDVTSVAKEHVLQIRQESPGGPSPPGSLPGSISQVPVTVGIVAHVDASNRRVTLRDGKSTTIPKKATILVEGRPGQLTEVHPGCRIEFEIDPHRGKIRVIRFATSAVEPISQSEAQARYERSLSPAKRAAMRPSGTMELRGPAAVSPPSRERGMPAMRDDAVDLSRSRDAASTSGPTREPARRPPTPTRRPSAERDSRVVAAPASSPARGPSPRPVAHAERRPVGESTERPASLSSESEGKEAETEKPSPAVAVGPMPLDLVARMGGLLMFASLLVASFVAVTLEECGRRGGRLLLLGLPTVLTAVIALWELTSSRAVPVHPLFSETLPLDGAVLGWSLLGFFLITLGLLWALIVSAAAFHSLWDDLVVARRDPRRQPKEPWPMFKSLLKGATLLSILLLTVMTIADVYFRHAAPAVARRMWMVNYDLVFTLGLVPGLFILVVGFCAIMTVAAVLSVRLQIFAIKMSPYLILGALFGGGGGAGSGGGSTSPGGTFPSGGDSLLPPLTLSGSELADLAGPDNSLADGVNQGLLYPDGRVVDRSSGADILPASPDRGDRYRRNAPQ